MNCAHFSPLILATFVVAAAAVPAFGASDTADNEEMSEQSGQMTDSSKTDTSSDQNSGSSGSDSMNSGSTGSDSMNSGSTGSDSMNSDTTSSGTSSSGSSTSGSTTSGSSSSEASGEANSTSEATNAASAGGMALVGMSVQGRDDEQLGEIENVLVDANGRAQAIVLDTGGFLGLSGDRWRVDWKQLQTRGDQARLDMTSEELPQQLEQYKPESSGGSGSGSGSDTGTGTGTDSGEQ